MKGFVLLVFFSIALHVNAQKISSDSAIKYVGKNVTVCGKVVYTYLDKQDWKMYLFFGDSSQQETFTIIIIPKNADKFTTDYRDDNVCVTGTIYLHNNKPFIVVSEPNQIEIVSTNLRKKKKNKKINGKILKTPLVQPDIPTDN